MAIVKGTNAGFVTTAPTSDPATGLGQTFDAFSNAIKDTSPSGAVKITEIGWWCDNATEEANFEVGIYTNSGDGTEPNAVVGSLDTSNAKGTSGGVWKRATGLNISISENTVYWLAVQLDNTSVETVGDRCVCSGERKVHRDAQTSLPSPWGTSTVKYTNAYVAIYAVYETAVETNMKINIADVWKDVDSIQINIGDAWKDVTEVHQNIGDAWIRIY